MRFYEFLKKDDTRILSTSGFQFFDNQQHYVGTSTRFIIDELPSLNHIDLILDINMKYYPKTNTFRFVLEVMFVDKIESFGKDAQFIELNEYTDENSLFINNKIDQFLKTTGLKQFQQYFHKNDDILTKNKFSSVHFKNEQFLSFISDNCLHLLDRTSDSKGFTVFNRNKRLFVEQITNPNRKLINLFSEQTELLDNSEDFNDFLELHFQY